jgi:alpha-L-rhamnosidase
MALEIGIVSEKLKEKVAASVVKNIHDKYDGFINTGIFGISRIFKVLAENGFEDEVYRLLTKTGENSFAFMWEHYDATTLWEILPVRLYESEEMAFRSHSHPMQAGYDAWFYSGIAGINTSPKDPGFKTIIFKPYLTKYLSNADASYQSPFGTIKSAWQNKEEQFLWSIQIPENSKGEIFVPNYGDSVSVSVNGELLNTNHLNTDFTSIGEFGSGSYSIKMTKN